MTIDLNAMPIGPQPIEKKTGQELVCHDEYDEFVPINPKLMEILGSMETKPIIIDNPINIDTMPAGPEMDRLVCEAVGIEPIPGLYVHDESMRIKGVSRHPAMAGISGPVYPAVSTEPGPAMEVVKKMGEENYWFSSDIMPLVNGTPVTITAQACFQKCPIMDKNPEHHAHAKLHSRMKSEDKP